MTTQFQVGKAYRCSSICDHNCVWTFVVVARTDKSVTFRDEDGKVFRKKVGLWNGAETCRPLGRYSFAPVLTAEKLVAA